MVALLGTNVSPSQPDIDVAKPDVTVDTEYVLITNEELEKPYRVIIQNDDVTPQDFVIAILNMIFDLEIQQAVEVMLTAHYHGRALVCVLPYEDAAERVYQAQSLARDAHYPLSFYLEPDE
jgi:ATP-dependent Clp protease adaptor protein ClpS